jgi:hypothetical protein
MGNNISSKNNLQQVPEIVHEIKSQQLSPVKYDKEIQTQDVIEADIPKQIESISVNIILPNYTYKWDGILEKAPHIIHKMTEIDWAKHMENRLIIQRKSCPWVKEHDRTRGCFIQIQRDSISGHIGFREPDWKSPCNMSCPGNNQSAWPGMRVHAKRYNGSHCSQTCYYQYTNKTNIHNLSCKLCSEPLVV